jgi:hypothetical protein
MSLKKPELSMNVKQLEKRQYESSIRTCAGMHRNIILACPAIAGLVLFLSREKEQTTKHAFADPADPYNLFLCQYQ